MNTFEKRQWQVSEYPFYPERIPHSETIFTIGNGLLGIRGSFEEGYPDDSAATLAAGIFNHKKGELVPELAVLPNPLTLNIRVNDEPFRLDRGKILGYERTLDLKTATLRRGVLWFTPDRTVVRFAFERFASLDNPHILALQVQIQVLSAGTHTVEITSALDGTVTNANNISHWTGEDFAVNGNRLHYTRTTDQSGYTVSMQAAALVSGQSGVWDDSTKPYYPAHHTSVTLPQNETITLTKLVAIHTSRDGDDPAGQCQQTLASAIQQGYGTLQQSHDRAWVRYWDACDIQIDGDEVAQRAVRFCTYHILIATPTDNERVSIGAKTLSGFGYKGHVFWDTELFMVPPLILCEPERARSLLMYRYHNLPGARAKAAEAGYEGAMFPWESTDTGEETTPRWANESDTDGNRIRIWTGDNEQHISSDIAYALLQFWRWTGDDDWFATYGAEIVLDTAKFWGSRAEYNADANRYELRMQIGPDEYHENIDNSVFTNRMVVWHLQQAQQIWDWLQSSRPDDAQRLAAALDITDARLAHWQDIATRMWIPMSDENGGVLEQFEGFFNRLHPFNLHDYTPRTTNMDWILGHKQTQTSRVIKQADVVMLMALLGDELGNHDFLRRNWDVYSRVVDHGSSLSPAIHAWVASQLGLVDEAYDLFIYSATLDLEDHKGNVRDGIHAACCGGVWQAVVFGFCGLTLTGDGPTVNPCLPGHWRRVQFNVSYRGQRIPMTITAEG